MKAYKGFSPNPDGTLKCLDKTYEVGETYTEDEAILCKRGMHACLAPIDVLAYYPPASSVFHVVEVDDDAQRGDGDSKVASRTLTVGAEVGIHELVAAQVEYTAGRAKPVDCSSTSEYQGAASAAGYRGAASATGTRGAASATGVRGAASATGDLGAATANGYRGAASATGDWGAASATGDWGAASATGTGGAATATGDQGAASATGYQGAATATGEFAIAHADGYGSKAKGASGCALTLVERATDGAILAVVAVIVGQMHDGQMIEPDVYYWLHNGKIEVAE